MKIDFPIYNLISTKMSQSSKYHELFMAALAQESTTDNFLDEWQYVGGDTGSKLNRFNTLYPNRERPDLEDHCICTHPIKENCYIENVHSKKLLVVGNCCVERFLSKERRCLICEKVHRNRKDPWCDECRGGIMRFGKHEHKSFRWIKENDPSYCQWILGTHRHGQLQEFKRWLQNQGMIRNSLLGRRSRDEPVQGTSREVFRNVRQRVNSSSSDPIEDSDLESSSSQENSRIFQGIVNNDTAPFDENLFSSSGLAPSSRTPSLVPRDRALQVGKYKGKMFSWVYRYDKGYCRWVLNLPDPGTHLQSFIEWLNYQPYFR